MLEGVLSEKHFANLTKLQKIDASRNSFVLRVSLDWVPPFQIGSLSLTSCQTGPSFPLWLKSKKRLYFLDISDSKISDTMPSWFWRLPNQFTYLNLSHNQISGQVLDKINFDIVYGYGLDLGFNNFTGPLPQFSFGSKPKMINLSDNRFSGSLFHFLCYQKMSTVFLRLVDNLLSGEIPDCWINWSELRVLRLDGNRFSGKIPTTMGTLTNLESLNLWNNKLQGEISESLKYCTRLLAINLGKNELDGNIPGWLGQDVTGLTILILRSNKFGGNIPHRLCTLTSLQILDLADNYLSGGIPECISNFTVMATRGASRDGLVGYYDNDKDSIYETASVMTKGQFLEYNKTLNLVLIVDLSENNLSGEIPKELTSLQGLQTLNLSENHLTEKIPEDIGGMVSVETLDLSQNHICGSIPKSMSSMTFLSNLNLSFNNFTGRIPTSSQLQGFNESCFAGNHLCGSPLKACGGSGKEPDVKNGTRKGHHEINWFYLGMPLGFVTGFWCVVGPFMFNRRWRIIYFRVLEEMWWKVRDFVLV